MSPTIEDKIREANRAYYAGHPSITDEQYDEMVESSGLLQYQVEELKSQSVIVLDKIKHYQPMTSLPKVKSRDMLKTKLDGEFRSYQLKLDGSSLEVHYDGDGHFDFGASRGDYTYGDNRTALVIAMIGLGKIQSTFRYVSCAVRGELIVSKSDMAVLSDEFVSQRSASSGIANRNDPTYAKFLTFIPYDIVFDDGRKWEYRNPDISFDTFEDAEAAFNSELYPCDGVVVKDYAESDENEYRDLTYAMAYKFADKQVETYIRDVNWQIGKTGKLTPVAKFDMVFIDAEVTRASLGSYELFKSLDLHYGDKILVKKANMVIPQVTKNLGGGGDEIHAPEWWNGQKTFVSGAHLYGFNNDRWKSVLIHQANVLFGKGVSAALVNRCVDAYECTTIYDIIQTVNRDDFSLKRYGAAKIANTRKAVAEIANKNVLDLLVSLEIDGMSWSRCMAFMKKVRHDAAEAETSQHMYLIDLRNPYDYIVSIKGIGHTVAKQFADSYGEVRDMLNGFMDAFDREVDDWQEEVKRDYVASILITGRLDFTRSKLKPKFEARNIKVLDGFVPGMDFLVCGDNPTMKKVDRAERDNVPIIYSTHFDNALGEIANRKAIKLA